MRLFWLFMLQRIVPTNADEKWKEEVFYFLHLITITGWCNKQVAELNDFCLLAWWQLLHFKQISISDQFDWSIDPDLQLISSVWISTTFPFWNKILQKGGRGRSHQCTVPFNCEYNPHWHSIRIFAFVFRIYCSVRNIVVFVTCLNSRNFHARTHLFWQKDTSIYHFTYFV